MTRAVFVSPMLLLLGVGPARAGLRQEFTAPPAPPASPQAAAKAPRPAPAEVKPAPAAALPAAVTSPAPAPSSGAAPAARGRRREKPVPLPDQVRELTRRLEALPALEARLNVLSGVEARLVQLEAEARGARAAAQQAMLLAASPLRLPEPTIQLTRGVRLHLRGYADLGLYVPLGDGPSFLRDSDGTLYPDYRGPGVAAVYAGDPWAATVNAQGDATDLGVGRTGVLRIDPIAAGGKPSFLANMGNVGMLADLGEQVHVGLNLNIEPRSGQLGATGDMFGLDLLFALWRPLRATDLEIYAGKFESNFGVEWRTRMAPDRVGVTPSLLARFTTGTPIGLRVRGSTLGGLLGYDLALTNGGTTTERFGHFHSELDRNIFKSASARVSLGKALLGADTNMGVPFYLEVGASGQVGAQDGQPDDGVIHWQAGADVRLAIGRANLRFEALRVSANGDRSPGAPWISASGLYAETWYQLRFFQALLRFDMLRGVLYTAGDLYVLDSARVSAALRFDIGAHVIAKVEYQHVAELGPAAVRTDTLTSALVLRF